MPKVTVLMSVYNGRLYLKESIESILNQTFNDFDLLIINDGSTDNSGEIILSFDDPRIRLIENPVNVGLTKSLNRGLKLAKGTLIARQDADDISLPHRLEHQLSYLESHLDIVLLGTWAKVIDENGKALRDTCSPINPFVLKWRMLFTNQIVHSSVMFNSEKVRQLGGYDSLFTFSQDYDLWLRIMKQHQIALLPEILVHRREHSNDISAKFFNSQNSTADRIACKNLKNLLKKNVSIEDVHNLRKIIHYRMISFVNDFNRLLKVLQEVHATIIREWEPDAKNAALITSDYLRMIKATASMCANLDRKAAFDILKTAVRKDMNSLFNAMTAVCFLKIIIGPKLVQKFRRFFGRN